MQSGRRRTLHKCLKGAREAAPLPPAAKRLRHRSGRRIRPVALKLPLSQIPACSVSMRRSRSLQFPLMARGMLSMRTVSFSKLPGHEHLDATVLGLAERRIVAVDRQDLSEPLRLYAARHVRDKRQKLATH